MGRRPSVNLNLPPRMRVKISSSGKKFYYHDLGGTPRRWVSLGSEFVEALRKYAEAEEGNLEHVSTVTFRHVAERYIKEVIPQKAHRTQLDNMTELSRLYKFFDVPPAPINEVRPIHIRQYLTWRREAPVRANRELALFSHIYNKAREWGYTDNSNPCVGIKKNKELGRTNYVDDATYKLVWDAADQPLRDALDLAYLTGQRPADVLKMDSLDIQSGELSVRQNKTSTLVRIRIEGDLATLIDRIKNRKNDLKDCSTRLIINENGRSLSYQAFLSRFTKARNAAGVSLLAFQFKDLRAKAGTDKEQSKGLAAAKDQLGHANESMTKHYVRNRLGKLVDPTR